MKTSEIIKEVARDVVTLLLKKNADYGDTANHPPQIFSKLSQRQYSWLERINFQE